MGVGEKLTPEEKVKRRIDNQDKAFDWQIAQTQNAIIETNKNETTALLTYFTVLIAVLILKFGGSNDTDKAMVPLIQISVNKNIAATIGVFLNIAALYWLCSLSIYGVMLSHRRMELLEERYEEDMPAINASWHLQPASLVGMTSILFATRKWTNIILFVLFLLCLFGAFVGPVVLIFVIGRQGNYLPSETFALCFVAILSLLPAGAALFTVKKHPDLIANDLDKTYSLQREGNPHLKPTSPASDT